MASHPSGSSSNDEHLNDDEVAQRRDAALLRALSTPHKRQKEMKVGKPRSVAGDPTINALRLALNREAAALEAGEHASNQLVSVILGSLPLDVYNVVFLPADGTRGPCLAISFKPAFGRYVTFAAEYWAGLSHNASLSEGWPVNGVLPTLTKFGSEPV
jgi:hypothetical protein